MTDPADYPWTGIKWRRVLPGATFIHNEPYTTPPPPTAKERAERARWKKERDARARFVGPTPVVARQAWLLRYGCGLPAWRVARLLHVRTGAVRRYLNRVEGAISRQWHRQEKSRRGWIKMPKEAFAISSRHASLKKGWKWRDLHLPIEAHQNRESEPPLTRHTAP